MSQKSSFVLTPRGFRQRSLVHSSSPGGRIRREGGTWKVISSTNTLLYQVNSAAPQIEPPAPVPGDGWISFADWQNTTGRPVSSFLTTWEVPPEPITLSNQTIFLFNSIMDGGATHILQPVLQWGGSAAPGSGNGWAIASWWVGQEKCDPCFISDLRSRECHGDTLTGRIQLIGQNNGLYNYACEFLDQPATRLIAEGISPELTDCMPETSLRLIRRQAAVRLSCNLDHTFHSNQFAKPAQSHHPATMVDAARRSPPQDIEQLCQ